MKLTYNWLKHYVDFDWSAEALAERLTMLGLEVEGVQKVAGEFEGIVVAQVLTKDKHPKADKLTLCRVHDGQGERQIVCGATNFQPGDKVPLILPGATLPAQPGKAPFTIQVSRIRGVESQGMMCSAEELGIDPAAIGLKKEEGLLILRPDARVGQPFAEYLGRPPGDVVFDLETTPNRPDWNSVIGIAREIAALTGNPLKLPVVEVPVPPSAPAAAALVAVRLEAPDLCPRYVARVVRGVKIGPSPDWLRATLEKVGLRSINNVVDVTNYVMLECGQPLHAFDYHLVGRPAGPPPSAVGQGSDAPAGAATRQDACPTSGVCPTIVVRRAREAEAFVTLDGQTHTLTGEMLLIADEHKGIALAGIMGGHNTEITDTTTDVLIESACFHPANIRRTSKALGLRTESSYRFERGADIGITDWASLRCAQLILQTAGGELAAGAVDAYPQPAVPREITLRHPRTNALLGVEVSVDTQIECLRRLGLEVVVGPGIAPSTGVRVPHATTFRVPSFRVDLKREVDLIEEIGRLYGVDRIPATAPRPAIGLNAFDAVHDQLADVRRLLTGLGLNETQGQTLIAGAECEGVAAGFLRLANPLSADMDALRPSLLPGLLAVLRHNLHHKVTDLALFEIGRVFAPGAGGPQESRRLAVLLTGRRSQPFWAAEAQAAQCDGYDLKGVLEEFFEHLGVRGVTFARQAEPAGLFAEAAEVRLGRQALGCMGRLAPAMARRCDARAAVFLAELDLDLVLARRSGEKRFRPLPAFPAVRRDIAMFVAEAVTHETIVKTIQQARPAHLEHIELFDVFRGRHVPAGQKSLAYALTYRHPDRTLTDAEVNAAHAQVLARLRQQLQAVIREGAENREA
jgi:phenylalanyl-tRNA synthetase beta chain